MSAQGLSYSDFEEIMQNIKSEELRQELEQVIMFFKMIGCTIEGKRDRENHEIHMDFMKDEDYFSSIVFIEGDDEFFSSMEVIGKQHRELQKDFLTVENKGFVSRRLGGLCVHKINETEQGYKIMIDVLRRIQMTTFS